MHARRSLNGCADRISTARCECRKVLDEAIFCPARLRHVQNANAVMHSLWAGRVLIVIVLP